MSKLKNVVLCVDDDQMILDSLKEILEQNDFIVYCAIDSKKGIEKYKECNPNLIIVDLMMEEITSGLDLVKDLKDLGNVSPVYMLSSMGNSLDSNIDTSDLGITGVFQKPVNPEYLIKTLNSIIQ